MECLMESWVGVKEVVVIRVRVRARCRGVALVSRRDMVCS